MRIDPHENILGFGMIRIRELLRRVRNWMFFTISDVATVMETGEEEAVALIQELEHRGFITRDTHSYRTEPGWVLTQDGFQFANAGARKPIKRATADRLLSEFLARIELINSDDHFLYKVSKVVLFGSYLRDVPTVGDIDLIVHLHPKDIDPKRHKTKCIARNQQLSSQGKRISLETMYIFYEKPLMREVFVKLRQRSAYLSLHMPLDEYVIRDSPHRVIFTLNE
jgi:predicted nucleotidyltransferase